MRAQAEKYYCYKMNCTGFWYTKWSKVEESVWQKGPYKTLIPLKSTAHFVFYCSLLLKHIQTHIHIYICSFFAYHKQIVFYLCALNLWCWLHVSFIKSTYFITLLFFIIFPISISNHSLYLYEYNTWIAIENIKNIVDMIKRNWHFSISIASIEYFYPITFRFILGYCKLLFPSMYFKLYVEKSTTITTHL